MAGGGFGGAAEAAAYRPQGVAAAGVASPLLANIYLHRVGRSWDVGRHGVLVRFADDLVVTCRSRGQAEAALTQLTAVL
jgi:retron-type reverse transcriptase